MKLINHTLLFLSGILLLSICLWGIFFYYQVLNQVRNTIDEGMANYKIVLIDKLRTDTLISERKVFRESNYIIRQIDEDIALNVRDTYRDTLIFSELKNENYQARLLTTAFLGAGNKYYELKVISHEFDRGYLIRKIASTLLWFFLFLIISTVVVNNFVLKKTWRPFYRLLGYLNRFQLDKGVTYEPETTKISEFSLLNESVKNLIKTNIDIYDSQKQFIENASHELQTPLAIGINKLELLAGENDLQQVHIEKIGNVIEILQRLSSLNKSLLLLSKIENRQFIDREIVCFGEIISSIVGDFSDYSEYMRINVRYKQEGSWCHSMNPDLARILVMNLLNNAMFHNRKDGEIDIMLSASFFKIDNTSDSPELSPDRLFRRFSGSNKNSGSSGLGLAIVKAIADFSGLRVTYSFNGKHVFSISI
ncbi:MAG: HAMP domain-containing histidine kinase [Bacteroidales bacterium]|nr:HAMP domain-containing histidine kinase [Bacteroidales bacterium]MBN2631963.1 HAMP domain-containing histidine kinase [Bacteroidales bacterium]